VDVLLKQQFVPFGQQRTAPRGAVHVLGHCLHLPPSQTCPGMQHSRPHCRAWGPKTCLQLVTHSPSSQICSGTRQHSNFLALLPGDSGPPGHGRTSRFRTALVHVSMHAGGFSTFPVASPHAYRFGWPQVYRSNSPLAGFLFQRQQSTLGSSGHSATFDIGLARAARGTTGGTAAARKAVPSRRRARVRGIGCASARASSSSAPATLTVSTRSVFARFDDAAPRAAAKPGNPHTLLTQARRAGGRAPSATARRACGRCG
jgi:hypothetical protein